MQLGKNRFFLPALFAIYIAAYYGWLLLFKGDETLLTAGGNLFSILSPVISMILLVNTCRRLKGHDRTFWLLMSLGMLSYAIAEGIWALYENIWQVEVPFPSWADLFYILQCLCFLIALLYKLYTRKNTFHLIRMLFDLLIVMTVAISFSWHFIIDPILSQHDVSTFAMITSLSYPVSDLVLLFGVISMALSTTEILPRNVLLLILSGFLIEIYADTAYLYLSSTGTYTSGSLYDPLWVAGLLLVGLSGFYFRESEQSQAATPASPYRELDSFDYARLFLPYLCLILLFVMMNLQATGINGIVIGSSVAIILLIIRQIVAILENNTLLRRLHLLNDQLEQQVTQRTQELSQTNTQLVDAYNKMQHMAYHDSLTNLPNRRFFEHQLFAAIAKARSQNSIVAVLFLDLDRFKNVNDYLGHAIGDLLLQQVAQRLRTCLREGDTVSRQGGDEFTIVLPDRTIDEISATAQAIRDALNQPFLLEGNEIRISMSMGIGVFPYDGDRVDTLMKNADTALYLAKERGKNNFQFFTAELNDRLSKKMLLETALHKALERGEFVVHYQPQVNIQTGKLTGAEALIRWHHPEIGLIPPSDFIPLAEENGLIIPIGEWMLEQTCRQNKRWQEQGYPPIKIGINLSARQFMQENLIDKIAHILQTTGLDPQYIDLEITESIAMQNVEHVIEKLRAMKSLGVQISIDDFGTGYSSLSYLKKFPIHTLKIAQEFINDITTNCEDRAIVQAIIAMARSLQLSVIAEGVETTAQMELLQTLQCDEIQGYLISKPVPAPLLEELLASNPQQILTRN